MRGNLRILRFVSPWGTARGPAGAAALLARRPWASGEGKFRKGREGAAGRRRRGGRQTRVAAQRGRARPQPASIPPQAAAGGAERCPPPPSPSPAAPLPAAHFHPGPWRPGAASALRQPLETSRSLPLPLPFLLLLLPLTRGRRCGEGRRGAASGARGAARSQTRSLSRCSAAVAAAAASGMTAEEMKADGAPLEGVDITLKRDEGVLKVPAGCGAVPSGVGGGAHTPRPRGAQGSGAGAEPSRAVPAAAGARGCARPAPSTCCWPGAEDGARAAPPCACGGSRALAAGALHLAASGSSSPRWRLGGPQEPGSAAGAPRGGSPGWASCRWSCPPPPFSPWYPHAGCLMRVAGLTPSGGVA